MFFSNSSFMCSGLRQSPSRCDRTPSSCSERSLPRKSSSLYSMPQKLLCTTPHPGRDRNSRRCEETCTLPSAARIFDLIKRKLAVCIQPRCDEYLVRSNCVREPRTTYLCEEPTQCNKSPRPKKSPRFEKVYRCEKLSRPSKSPGHETSSQRKKYLKREKSPLASLKQSQTPKPSKNPFQTKNSPQERTVEKNCSRQNSTSSIENIRVEFNLKAKKDENCPPDKKEKILKKRSCTKCGKSYRGKRWRGNFVKKCCGGSSYMKVCRPKGF